MTSKATDYCNSMNFIVLNNWKKDLKKIFNEEKITNPLNN